MTTPAAPGREPHPACMVNYDVIQALGNPTAGLHIEPCRAGTWTVDRNCDVCHVTVQLPHPRYAELDAFRVAITNLGCFASWNIPRGTYITVTVRNGRWHVVDRFIRPGADFAPPAPRRPCPAQAS